LWNEEDPDELVMLKLLPRGGAKQTQHSYVPFTSYGNTHSESAFAPNALPPVQDFKGDRETTLLKLYGNIAQVQGLVALENTIRAMGQDNVVDVDRETVRRILLYKINIDLHESDTRLTHNVDKFKGTLQLIDEKTRATGATVPDSNIIIDMRGSNLTLDGTNGIRAKSREVTEFYGKMRWILMAPGQVQKLEETLDDKSRYLVQQVAGTQKKILGAEVDGAITGSGLTMFAPDVALGSRILTGRANKAAISGAPLAFIEAGAGAGTFGAPAPIASGALPPGLTSYFQNIDIKDASGTGSNYLNLFYEIVAVNEIGASVAGVSSSVQASLGGAVSIVIRPRGEELSFKIYRGLKNAADTAVLYDAEFIAEVPNGAAKGNTTPFTFYDDNETIPGTTHAFGMNIHSDHSVEFAQGKVPTTLNNEARKSTNGASLIQLSPLFVFDLAKINWLAANELLLWVLAPQIEKPFQHRVWKNLGRKQLVTGVYA